MKLRSRLLTGVSALALIVAGCEAAPEQNTEEVEAVESLPSEQAANDSEDE
jgi:hypothetical protein